jgi:hypothetical protein
MMLKSLSLTALTVASVVAAGPSLAQQPIRIGASVAVTGRDKVQGGYVREGYLLCQMPRKRPQVLGVDLNRSESPEKGQHGPVVAGLR